jgi:single-stranded-DNA-specific exonuclease
VLTASHIGFNLAPRLNAAGRLASPKPALEILCETDRSRSARLAAGLEQQNEQRRRLTDRVTEDAINEVMGMKDWQRRGGFVLAGKDWDEGVLGIAASRVVEDFGRPALLISLAGETAKGSGRSIPGVHLKEQLDRCSRHLQRFGGHAAAVGFSLDPAQVDDFRTHLTRCLDEATANMPKQPQLSIDADLTLEECSLELLDFLARCEPFGHGNRTPVWMIPRVTVLPDTRIVGKGHLKLHFQDESGHVSQGILFNWGTRGVDAPELHGKVIDMAVRLKKGYYLERYYADIHLADLREAQ